MIGAGSMAGYEEMLLARSPDKVLPGLERMLFTENNVGVVIDYAETVAPAGDASFSSENDRLSLVTLQRWSLAPQLEASDNIVVLLAEVPSELNPKIVANPRVAAVQVPMPGIEERRAAISSSTPRSRRAGSTGWPTSPPASSWCRSSASCARHRRPKTTPTRASASSSRWWATRSGPAGWPR